MRFRNVMRRYPNFSRTAAGWVHPLETGGQILITEEDGPSPPNLSDTVVMIGVYRTAEDIGNGNALFVRNVAVNKLEALIDQQLKAHRAPAVSKRGKDGTLSQTNAQRIIDALDALAERWRHEHEHEDWAEYETALRKLAPPDAVDVRATKQPFELVFSLGVTEHHFLVRRRSIEHLSCASAAAEADAYDAERARLKLPERQHVLPGGYVISGLNEDGQVVLMRDGKRYHAAPERVRAKIGASAA